MAEIMQVPGWDGKYFTITESAQTRFGPWHVTNVFAQSMFVWNQITNEKLFYPLEGKSGQTFRECVLKAVALNVVAWDGWWHKISPVPDIKRCFSYYATESSDGYFVVIGCAKGIKGYMETGLILPHTIEEGKRILHEMNHIYGVSEEQAMEIVASTL